jgi:hypothetical protein
VYSATNLQKTRDDLRYQRVVLAVADGGFKLGRDEHGVHQVGARAFVVCVRARETTLVLTGELSRVVFGANCAVRVDVCCHNAC